MARNEPIVFIVRVDVENKRIMVDLQEDEDDS